ncbi:transposase [Chryseobacterium sp. SIMBA_038]|uniref:transposase n=1 Tax=Chryseobacterium sp. SIMBA_038 TaxID=3085780 RepID=UPI00397D3D7C
MDFKNIHIGNLIEKRVQETNIDIFRICKFLGCEQQDIEKMYASTSIDSNILLRWSKLLEYDFFRIYSQHLLFYSSNQKEMKSKETSLPQFRKNIYTKEIIDFILDSLKSGEKTKQQIMEGYRIPKTTLYKWISKSDEVQ